jgi:3' terminal RNA ribose 2'-O-methyltransferase Hen1
MLLSITTTHRPATDLGFLLVKHPERCQTFSLAFGQAHVFYPEASEMTCTACLLLDVDPIGLVRGRQRAEARAQGTLAHYVNDRPYVASSLLSVALAQVLGSALRGDCKARPELASRELPLVARLAVVRCRGGEAFLRRLFEPLGYQVTAERVALDEKFPEWGESPYFRVELARTTTLSALLTHLYVLLPVLDNDKHYWVGRDELEKLLARGEGWLANHPERAEISHRYLKHQRSLAREAIARLSDDEIDPDGSDDEREHEEQAIEERISLNDERLGTVLAVLKKLGARRVIDLGCGEGRLLRLLMREKTFATVAGVDVSHRALELAASRLKLDGMPERQRERLSLFQGSLTYRDSRFAGYDAACAIEVVEHIEPSRLGAFERTIFELASPRAVIVTTPNVEYNPRFENLPAGKLRHRDHRFEWTRAEFQSWAETVADRHGYRVRFVPIGPVDPELGAPTQMGVFEQ